VEADAVIDDATGEVVVPNGSIGFRYGEEGMGKWNLDLGDVDPTPELYAAGSATQEAVTVILPRFDIGPRRRWPTRCAACRCTVSATGW
jgi:nitrate reductase alpha subunit